MKIEGTTALVSGGASGLGLATTKRLVAAGAHVVVLDLRDEAGPELEALGGKVTYATADVTDAEQLEPALEASIAGSELRAVVHTAGIGEIIRVVERDGSAGSLEKFQRVIDINLIGSWNVLRLAAAQMATNDPLDGDRGVVIMTASVAAYEGQIGQIAYSASKAAIVGMTIVAARDLASKGIRVNTIAPGTFDTPLLAQLSEEVRASLGKAVPHPSRLGDPDEYGFLAQHIIENPVLNGETIRLDGAIRMPPR